MYPYPRRRGFRARRRLPGGLLPLLAALVSAAALFSFLSARLLPQIRTVAVSRATNQISLAISEAVDECLAAEELEYSDLITMETDGSGRVTSLAVRTGDSTRFRRLVTGQLVERLDSITPDTLSVPLGSLTGVLLLSAVGPSVRVRIQSVGDVVTEYIHEYTSAGVNQTRHSVCLKISATVYLLIPGEIVPVSVEDRICVAETVIVGEVPNTYLNVQKGES